MDRDARVNRKALRRRRWSLRRPEVVCSARKGPQHPRPIRRRSTTQSSERERAPECASWKPEDDFKFRP